MTEANFTDEEAERRAEDLRAVLERVRRVRNKNGENLTFVQMLREMADVMEHQKVSVLDLEGMEKALTPAPAEALADRDLASDTPLGGALWGRLNHSARL